MLKASQLHYPPVLKSIDLSLAPGEMVALVGGNGSGKSTLLRLLSGLVAPQSGSIEIDGKNSQSPDFVTTCRRLLGLVFQNPESQLVANTVDEEVAFGPGQSGLERSQLQERVEWALNQVGLWERRRWQSHALSAGQKQRLAVAAVLASRPRYLLLDEPTSMLDPQARRDLMTLLDQLRAEVGILLITHRSEELERCDRVLHLQDGEISQQVTGPQLWDKPELFAGLELAVPTDLKLRGLLAESTPSQPYHEFVSANSGHPEATPAADPFALFEGLSYEYARGTPMRHQALSEVNCQLPQGRCSALIGQTGSGKSTLLQHLNLLLRPQQGRCQLLGEWIKPTTPARPIRQRVGMLFQQPEAQFFQETVWEEVAYAPANFGLEKEENTRAALQMVDLPAEQFGQRSPFELSGGEQRRLALACALAYRPEALVLDEPGAGLDYQHRQRVWQLLKQLGQQGVTLTLISHDLEEVGELAQHLVWLDQGKVVGEGPPGGLFGPLQQAGFEIPAWSRWAAENFPQGVLPVNEAQFRAWQERSL